MIGLFFGGKQFKTIFGNGYGNIELDANLEESHEWKAEATSNPVEEGSPVSDHVIEHSDKLKIRGFVSDASMESIFSSNNLSSRGLSRVIGLFNGRKIESHSQGVFDTLRTLIKKRETVTVYTKHRVYPDMVLTDVNIPRTASNGEAIEFTAEFIHIRKVATKTVDVPKGISAKKEGKAGSAVQKKAEAAKDAGKKQAEVKKSSSVLDRIFN